MPVSANFQKRLSLSNGAEAPIDVQYRLARRTPDEVWALAENIVSHFTYTHIHNNWPDHRVFLYHPKYKGLCLKQIKVQREKEARLARKQGLLQEADA